MDAYLAKRLYKPRKDASFWCNLCDWNIVDSTKPESGDFFVQFGHMYSIDERQYSGEYTGVMFALCKNCQK